MLTNLVKNSREAMVAAKHQGQRAVLRISVEQLDTDLMEIRISDNGCGIGPENLDKIFNHGFTTKDQGHGFGLHTCANFMTEMGGTLRAESDGIGKGATFVMRFPLNQQDLALKKREMHQELEAGPAES